MRPQSARPVEQCPLSSMSQVSGANNTEELVWCMHDILKSSTLADAEKEALTKELIAARYSIRQLINTVYNTSKDDFYTRLAPDRAPNCTRLGLFSQDQSSLSGSL